MKKTYELVVLLNPTLTSDLLKKTQEDIVKFVTSQKGSVKKTEEWGRKVLAYPIAKHTDAMFVLYQIELDSSNAQALERLVQLNDSVIRHLLVVNEGKA